MNGVEINEQIRTSRFFTVCFSIYISLMLFQTPYMKLGTITSFISIMLVVVANFICKSSLHHFRISFTGRVLLLFIISTSLFSLLRGGVIPSKLIAQVLLLIVISGISISEEEAKIYKWIYCGSCTVYSILIIRSCLTVQYRYFHGDVELFGTLFDPNFLCIPLGCALAFLVDNVLNLVKPIICTLQIAVVGLAVVMTSSRGGFLSIVISFAIIFIAFTCRKGKAKMRRVFMIIVLVIVFGYIVNYVSIKYNNEWVRMTSISLDNDNGRFIRWKKAIDLWSNAPLFGNGYGSLGKISDIPHNTFLSVLGENGLLGLALYVLFWGSTIYRILLTKQYTYLAVGICLIIQLFLLSALDNRCLWVTCCLLTLLTNYKSFEKQNSNIKKVI